MDKLSVDQLYDYICDVRKDYSFRVDPIDSLTRINEFTQDDIKNLILRMVNGDIFLWLDYISYKLPVIANDSISFVQLLKTIITKVNRDLAQGVFVRALIKIGNNNTKLGISLYNKLIDRPNEKTHYHYASLILGGVGQKDRVSTKSYVKKIFDLPNDVLIDSDSIKAGLVATSQVMLEKDNDFTFYLDLLSSCLITNNEQIIGQGVMLAVDLVKRDQTGAYNFFEKIMELDLVQPKIILADKISISGINNKELEIRYMQKLATIKNPYIAHPVCHYFARNNSLAKDAAFNVLIVLIKNDKHSSTSDLRYLTEEFAKVDANFYINKIEEYVKNAEDVEVLYELDYLLMNFIGHSDEDPNRTERLHEIGMMIKERIAQLYQK